MTPRSPKSPKPRAAPSKAMREVLAVMAMVCSGKARVCMNPAHAGAFDRLARELRSRAQRGARKEK